MGGNDRYKNNTGQSRCPICGRFAERMDCEEKGYERYLCEKCGPVRVKV